MIRKALHETIITRPVHTCLALVGILALPPVLSVALVLSGLVFLVAYVRKWGWWDPRW